MTVMTSSPSRETGLWNSPKVGFEPADVTMAAFIGVLLSKYPRQTVCTTVDRICEKSDPRLPNVLERFGVAAWELPTSCNPASVGAQPC
jgi:hypothetical protein